MPDVPADRNERVMVFVDFWNLALTQNEEIRKRRDRPWRIDWTRFPNWLVARAGELASVSEPRYAGTKFYSSVSASSRMTMRHKTWVEKILRPLPGFEIVMKEQKPRSPKRCRNCNRPINRCPHCSTPITRMVEKGVDTALGISMIRHAYRDDFDIAVLVTSDTDLVPAVEAANDTGRKVVQAGFGFGSADLTQACWASIDIYEGRDEIEFRRR